MYGFPADLDAPVHAVRIFGEPSMEPTHVDHAHSLLGLVAASEDAPAEALAALDQLVAWCHAARLRCVDALERAGQLHRLAIGTHRSQRDNDALERGLEAARRAPAFAGALERGAISSAHLDELGRSLRRLTTEQQRQLLNGESMLLTVASAGTSNEFARFLRREERRLGRMAGMNQLEQQQRSVRLRARTDRDSGMRSYSLLLDPLSAVGFEQRLDAAVEALFHDAAPPGCPLDPFERQEFLRAHALLALSEGGRTRSSRPEIVVVVDATDPHAEPTVDWGLPVEVPVQVLHELWGWSDVLPVIVRNGVVLHAPGELMLGRTTRLANRAQRRALRAMYPRCAIPGCETRFQHCKIHHVHWWRNGGTTDLLNLLPLCHRHHQSVHVDGWVVELSATRALTIRLPDGRSRSTGPPGRRAA
jgi:hypothetical protein